MRHIVLGKREGRLEFWYRTMVAFSLLAGEWLGGGVAGWRSEWSEFQAFLLFLAGAVHMRHFVLGKQVERFQGIAGKHGQSFFGRPAESRESTAWVTRVSRESRKACGSHLGWPPLDIYTP